MVTWLSGNSRLKVSMSVAQINLHYPWVGAEVSVCQENVVHLTKFWPHEVDLNSIMTSTSRSEGTVEVQLVTARNFARLTIFTSTSCVSLSLSELWIWGKIFLQLLRCISTPHSSAASCRLSSNVTSLKTCLHLGVISYPFPMLCTQLCTLWICNLFLQACYRFCHFHGSSCILHSSSCNSLLRHITKVD